MIYIVLTYLFLSVFFYLVFGGADFGVGIIEFYSGKKNKEITKGIAYRVIGPVWEANHIWLVLVIVIMWIVFPHYYYYLTTQLHIPLTLLLIGIIARGTAFVFRHYDAVVDDSQKIYDKIFEYGSVFSTFMIGVNAGALLSGEIVPQSLVEGASFKTLYIDTWFNAFSLLTGVFTVSLSAFLSAIFIIGESEGAAKDYYIKKAKVINIVIVVSSILIFLESLMQGREFGSLLFTNWFSIAAITIVALMLFPLWKFIHHENKNFSRMVVVAQVFFMLIAWSALSFPNLIFTSGEPVSILDNLPNEEVILVTVVALLGASVFVLPGLYHLFKQFGLIQNKKRILE